jgi:DNA-binding NarL/FixJ family response regulator
MAAPVNVMLVDHQVVLREGLRLLIEQEEGLAVVAQASSPAEAVGAGVDPAAVDVVVVDVSVSDVSGAHVVADLAAAFPAAVVLVLSTVRHPSKVQEVLAAGAGGYVLKTATPGELLHGIRAVASGGSYLQPSLGVALARWSGAGPGTAPGQLSAREEEVLRLVAHGYTNNEIAGLMSTSLRTVETHRTRVAHKLGRRSRAELVRYAIDAGLADFGG